MKSDIIFYLAAIDELKPNIKKAFVSGVKLGIWIGGALTFMIALIVRSLL